MRTAIFALVLSALPIAASAQSATVSAPTSGEIVRALGGDSSNRIYNLSCDRVDHRTFVCDFDMPPESVTRHVQIQAVWVGTDWSITMRGAQ